MVKRAVRMSSRRGTTNDRDDGDESQNDNDTSMTNVDPGLRQKVLDLLDLIQDDDEEEAEVIIDDAKSMKLCYELLEAIEEKLEDERLSNNKSNRSRRSDTASSSTMMNVRELLGGNIPSTSMAKLPLVLAKLQAHRIGASAFMPATQDEAANAEVLFASTTAMTISELAMVAGRLHATLLGVPGALGAGIIDVGALSGMAALVKRWMVECRGREPGSKSSDGSGKSAKRGSNHAQIGRQSSAAAGSRRSNTRKKKKLNTPPKKRKRNRGQPSRRVQLIEEMTTSESEVSSDSDSESHGRRGNSRTTKKKAVKNNKDRSSIKPNEQLAHRGLLLSKAISSALLCSEFRSWSVESREAIIDAATVAVSCTSALYAGFNDDADCRRLEDLCTAANRALAQGLENACCVHQHDETIIGSKTTHATRSPSAQERNSSGDSDLNQSQNKTTVYVLRGLYPLLSYQTETPNGHKGRMAAHKVAIDVLRKLVKDSSNQVSKGRLSAQQGSAITAATATIGAAAAIGSTTKKQRGILSSAKRGRRLSSSVNPSRRRRSFLMASGNRRGAAGESSAGSPVTPSLKANATPKSVRFRRQNQDDEEDGEESGDQHNSDECLPHPMLSPIIGLMQKLATLTNLNKADARARIATILVECCLSELPPTERSYYIRFLSKLTFSRRATHRLFALELIGQILAEKWLWEEHCHNEAITFEELRLRGLQASHSNSSSKEHNNTDPTTFWIDGIGSRKSYKCPPLALLTSLQARLDDKTPAVRARAAMSLSSLLSNCIKEDGGRVNLARSSNNNVNFGTTVERQKTMFHNEHQLLRHMVLAISAPLLRTLRRRAQSDGKASVRTAAIRGFTCVLLIDCGQHQVAHETMAESPITREDVDFLTLACSDQSTAARKAATESISSLLHQVTTKSPPHSMLNHQHPMSDVQDMLESAWLSSVLPLALDYEQTCVTKALEMVNEIVIEPLLRHKVVGDGRESSKDASIVIAWSILARVGNSQQQAGSGRASFEALVVCMSKLLQTESATLSKPLLRVLRNVASATLDLDAEGHRDDDGEEDLLNNSYMESWLFQTGIDQERRGAWCMLQVLAQISLLSRTQGSGGNGFSLGTRSCPIDGAFLSLAWEKLDNIKRNVLVDTASPHHGSINFSCRSCLQLMVEVAAFMPAEAARETFSSIDKLIQERELSLDLISCAVAALISLTVRLESNGASKTDHDSTMERIRDACATWISKTYDACQKDLESVLSSVESGSYLPSSNECANQDNGNAGSRLVRALYTVGEVTMIGFSADQDSSKNTRGKASDIDAANPVMGLHVLPSTRLVDLIRTLLPTYLPTRAKKSSRVEVPDSSGVPTPINVRAHAFVTLGKICLRDETLAKECINLLSRELHGSRDFGAAHPLVQSNALLILSDLCVRYTNMVDRHLPQMAACLQATGHQDGETGGGAAGFDLVRKHSVLLLSSLLLQDYIKWRGLLIHRFLAATVDLSPTVSKTAEATLCGPLLSKQANLFQNNFVEAMFVLNDCNAHPIYAAAARNGDNGAGIAIGVDGIKLSGTAGRTKRLHIYRMMLSRMTDEEKISVSARLAREVLGGALESSGDLRAACGLKDGLVPDNALADNNVNPKMQRLQNAANVIKDTLTVLTSPWCRVGKPRVADKDGLMDGADPDVSVMPNNSTSGANQLNAVKGRLLSKISRKHLIETVVPILCSLKTILEDNCSVLVKDLMVYLVDIFRNYRSEVKELLAGNPTLLQEIEYDTKQFEKVRREKASAAKKKALQSFSEVAEEDRTTQNDSHVTSLAFGAALQ